MSTVPSGANRHVQRWAGGPLTRRLAKWSACLPAVAARERFRQRSYFSDIALGVISGFGGEGYLLALQAIINRIEPGDD